MIKDEKKLNIPIQVYGKKSCWKALTHNMKNIQQKKFMVQKSIQNILFQKDKQTIKYQKFLNYKIILTKNIGASNYKFKKI